MVKRRIIAKLNFFKQTENVEKIQYTSRKKIVLNIIKVKKIFNIITKIKYTSIFYIYVNVH